MARRVDLRDAGGWDAFTAFMAEPRGEAGDVSDVVRAILSDVRARGAEAVAEATQRFDRLALDPQSLQAPGLDLEKLAASCPEDLRRALDFAYDRIAAYHEKQMPADHRFTDAAGADLGWRWTAVDAVGLYAPGGRASYPSSVLMNAAPARIAGVGRIVLVAPAPDGALSPAVAYAALKVGVSEYYPIGGAQAVAALAYGAGPLRPVDKIVGPGNAYVAEAKRQVFGTVGIDTIAGPSEICVVSDSASNPAWIAADLLSQAEHDPASQAILITDDAAFADAVEAEVEAQLSRLATQGTARHAWTRHSAILIVGDLLEAAARAVDHIAPEHLEVCVDDPEPLGAMVRHAGAIFLGRHAPEALGDYVTGSNHVLPTSRTARFSSGLSVTDFMKRTSIQRLDAQAFSALAGAALTLAEAEGLPAHAASVALRQSNRAGRD